MSLQQLFYVSRATNPFDSAGVQDILTQSRRNNRAEDVTGCLLFSGHYFAQVLEGSRAAVDAAMARIQRDSRHTDFRLLVESHITQRLYGDWTMGYLHDLDLEDQLQGLLQDLSFDAGHVVEVMKRMQPDPVMGAIR